MANKEKIGARAKIDFHCLNGECDGIVKFNLADVAKTGFQAVCEKCHNTYELDSGLRGKLGKMLKLIMTIREVEDIMGNCNVAVTVAGGEVKIPYALLLTRLNTIITLDFGGEKVDFHLWVEPTSPDTFR